METPPADELKSCKNCGKSLRPKHRFCPQCGQSAKVKPLVMRDLWKEAVNKVLHADSSVINLLRGLATAPGHTIRGYLDGQRKRYYSPVKFLLFNAGISVFLNNYFQVLERMPNGMNNPGTELSARYFNLIIILDVPVLALLSWLFFRKKGFSYAEHLVFHSFLGGFRTFFFMLILTPLAVLLPAYYYSSLTAYILIWTIYFTWACLQLFGIPALSSILKSVLIVLINQILVASVLGGVIYVKGKIAGRW